MDDQELLLQFENCTFPHEQWDHRAHVKVAFLYLREFPFDDALTKMREGIKKYNTTNNVPESEFQGYNETTTHAFLCLVYAMMNAYGELYPTPNADAFCDTHPHLLNKHILRLFYSPERRKHPDAKTSFVEPDLAPLPRMTSEL